MHNNNYVTIYIAMKLPLIATYVKFWIAIAIIIIIMILQWYTNTGRNYKTLDMIDKVHRYN